MWKVYLPTWTLSHHQEVVVHAGSPIRSIIPSLEGPVLSVLAGTTAPLSGRRIATLAGASHPAATACLGRLARAGVVLASPVGSAILYTANREHLAWPAIEALAHLRTTTLELLRSTTSAWEVAPEAAVVFGSFARGDGDENSDIDVLLVRPADLDDDPARLRQWDEQLSNLSDLVERATGNSVQLLDEDLPKLRRRLDADDPILASWAQDGIDLTGRTLRQVLSTATELELT
jgi:predicted nucleotidyltransferase